MKNIFDSEAQCIVIPTNTEGVMGAGLAKQFSDRFGFGRLVYVEKCKTWNVNKEANYWQYHRMKVNNSLALDKVITFYFFPTKLDWRNPSKYEYIADEMPLFLETMKKLGIKSFSMPRLGCGLGTLDWSKVKAIIYTAISNFDYKFDFIEVGL